MKTLRPLPVFALTTLLAPLISLTFSITTNASAAPALVSPTPSASAGTQQPEALSASQTEALRELIRQARREGGNSGGGGNDVGVEFQRAFLNAVQEIRRRAPEVHAKLLEARVEKFANEALVIVVDDRLEVQISGFIQNSVAYNNPEFGVILVHREEWQKIKSQRQREAIALHEVLSLAGIESSGRYPISAAYAADANFLAAWNSLRRTGVDLPPAHLRRAGRNLAPLHPSTNDLAQQVENRRLGLSQFFTLTNEGAEARLGDLQCSSSFQRKINRLVSTGTAEQEIRRLRMQISQAIENELMAYQLASDANRTHLLSRNIALAATTPILIYGISSLGFSLGAATAGEGFMTLASTSFFLGTISLNGYLLTKNYQYFRDTITGSQKQLREAAARMEGLAKVLITNDCDISDLHSEITQQRANTIGEMDQSFYRLRNSLGFGSKSARITAELYALSLMDRMVYQIELTQLQQALRTLTLERPR